MSKTKVCIYTRVSTSMQIDGYSLDAQKSRMKASCEYNDYEIAGEYEDAGKSGKSIEGRAAFNRMLEDIKSGKDEVIYSRVTGSTRGEFHKQMEKSGYKCSSDFIEYLLRVNNGKQVDGVTLKEFMDTMKDVVYELKKHFGIWKNLIKTWKTEY